jgi:hypothetical protein
MTHFFLASAPAVAWERVPWKENPILQGGIFAFALVLLVGTVLAWPLGWVARRWYGVKTEELVRIPARARLALWLTALTFLLFLVDFAAVLGGDPRAIAVAIPTSLRIGLVLPLLGAALTLVCLYCAVVIQQQGFGRRLTRFAYSATVLAFITLLWQLNVWNLLGWRY